MAAPHLVQPVKLICGLLGGDLDLLRRARQLLVRRFGPTDLKSDVWPFDQSCYYEPQMGAGLQRWFLSFERTIRPDALAEIKLETNALERRIAEDCLLANVARPVNLDPGYLDLLKLVLATTKDRAHRIYIGMGIFAEVTLQFTGGRWESWPWTYPDYRRPEYQEFFLRVRQRFLQQRAPVPQPPSPPVRGDA